jgi:hypothetical protein
MPVWPGSASTGKLSRASSHPNERLTMQRLLSFDPITKTRHVFHWDPVEETSTIHSEQDVTACLELSQAEYAATDERAPWKKDMQKVASIPMNEVGELMRSGVWFDDQALKKYLNDRDRRRFRTRPGWL